MDFRPCSSPGARPPTPHRSDGTSGRSRPSAARPPSPGSAVVAYDSAAGVLTVVSQSTTVTYIDPANDCLGLIVQGENLPVLPDSYDVVV